MFHSKKGRSSKLVRLKIKIKNKIVLTFVIVCHARFTSTMANIFPLSHCHSLNSQIPQETCRNSMCRFKLFKKWTPIHSFVGFLALTLHIDPYRLGRNSIRNKCHLKQWFGILIKSRHCFTSNVMSPKTKKWPRDRARYCFMVYG